MFAGGQAGRRNDKYACWGVAFATVFCITMHISRRHLPEQQLGFLIPAGVALDAPTLKEINSMLCALNNGLLCRRRAVAILSC